MTCNGHEMPTNLIDADFGLGEAVDPGLIFPGLLPHRVRGGLDLTIRQIENGYIITGNSLHGDEMFMADLPAVHTFMDGVAAGIADARAKNDTDRKAAQAAQQARAQQSQENRAKMLASARRAITHVIGTIIEERPHRKDQVESLVNSIVPGVMAYFLGIPFEEAEKQAKGIFEDALREATGPDESDKNPDDLGL